MPKHEIEPLITERATARRKVRYSAKTRQRWQTANDAQKYLTIRAESFRMARATDCGTRQRLAEINRCA